MVYVITGGPGFGKTTIIRLLEKRGFPVGSEMAREILYTESSQKKGSNMRLFPVGFERKVAIKRINFLNSVDPNTIAFSDRGLPDQIAYSWYKNKIPSNFIEDAVLTHRYAPFVFVTPPWKDIFCKDEIRNENFAEASEIHGHILRSYLKYGYETIDLPLLGPDKRIEFILNFLAI